MNDWQQWFLGRAKWAAFIIFIVLWTDWWMPYPEPLWYDLARPVGIVWAIFFPEHFSPIRNLIRERVILNALALIAAFFMLGFGAAVAYALGNGPHAMTGYAVGFAFITLGTAIFVRLFSRDDDDRSRRSKRSVSEAIKNVVQRVVRVHGVRKPLRLQ